MNGSEIARRERCLLSLFETLTKMEFMAQFPRPAEAAFQCRLFMTDDYATHGEWMRLLASRVRDYRLLARMTQQELAIASGVGLSSICRFERGESSNLTLKNFISLLKVLGMEGRLEELLPSLPSRPLTIREMQKVFPKRIRKKKNDA